MSSHTRSADRVESSTRPSLRFACRVARLVPAVFLVLALAACQSGEEGAEGAPESAASAESGTPEAGAPADVPEGMQEQMALMGELQSINQQLIPIRDEALSNPEMQARQEELQSDVDAAMREINPEFPAMQADFDSLRAELGVAQEGGEEAEVQSLVTEMRTLQGAMQETQTEAIEREDIAAAIETFRDELYERMRELDPRADSLINRAEELNAELEEMTGGGGG